MDQLEAVVIGDDNPIDFSFSPDGRWVVFNVERTLRKVAVSGGPSQTLITLPTLPYHGASWGADDTIVTGLFGADLVQVPASGGTVTTLAAPSDNRMFWHPQILPGGRAVLFTASEFRPDEQEVQVLVLSTGERRTLVTGSAGRFLPSGHLVFVRGATMWAVGFDPERLEVRGTPVPILEGIRVEPGGAVQFSVGEDGTLVYLRGTTPGNRLAWIDRAGKVERLDMASQSVLYPRLSPDGTRVALIAQGGIWIWHLGRKTFTRLTDPGSELKSGRYWNVWWTPDGQRLVLAFQHENEHAVYWQAADGTGAAERIVTSTTWIDQGSVSPDGRWLVLGAATSASGHDIVAVDLGNMGGLHARVSSEPSDSTRELRPLVQTKFNERNPEISPDGRWVAYDSDESGSFEVYVRPFPDVNAGRWQISERGGVHPRWGRNGHELFYVAPDRSVMSVPMQPRTGLAVGGATRVADLSPSNNPHGGRMYDVSADGTRILAVQDADEAGQAEIHVVLNWIEELKQRVPTR
jgi:serine/threonine-protein kinase